MGQKKGVTDSLPLFGKACNNACSSRDLRDRHRQGHRNFERVKQLNGRVRFIERVNREHTI